MTNVLSAPRYRCWYRFETDGEQVTVIADAQNIRAWQQRLNTEHGHLMLEDFEENFGLRPFLDEMDCWGFGGCCRYAGESPDGTVRLVMPLPSLDFDGKSDRVPGYEAACSLEILLDYLSYTESDPPKWKQGLTAQVTTVKRDFYGGIVSAKISPDMALWFSNAFAHAEGGDAITLAMRKAAARLWGSGLESRNDLFNRTKFCLLRGTPYFDSGFGGTLGLDGTARPEQDGSYELSPHNTDGALSQLTILTGLAKLDQLFHEYIR
ncbi:hypothetical protein IPH19_00375 [Candidatus Uhrbacteria bacterium]|nr:MAG: hypothetical protein IPH19_00375 [Candidatus Uhrbacteria bacterium]